MGNAIMGLLRSRKFLVFVLTSVTDVVILLFKDRIGLEVAEKLATGITTLGMLLIGAIAAEDMAEKLGKKRTPDA